MLLAAALLSSPMPGVVCTAAGSDAALLPGSDGIVDTGSAVLDVAALGSLDGLLDRLSGKRLIFVGETHDRYEDHLNQLAVIRGLRERGRDLVIGVEFFQQPFQPVLDAWVAGTLSEAELLRQTGYFERWRFDWRLYRPILRYAREHRIPVVALNVPAELVELVSDKGLAALDPADHPGLPREVDRGDSVYRDGLKTLYEQHPQREGSDFERFLDVQLLWDEGMAERAAAVLREYPQRTLVVLAGVGHVEYGRGIPARVQRRVPVPTAILINGSQRAPRAGLADFVLYPQPVGLPATGLLGVMLDTATAGNGVGVTGFAEVSGARDAGVRTGDRIVGVGGRPITEYADIRIALMDSRPGEQVAIEVERKALLGGNERHDLRVQLH